MWIFNKQNFWVQYKNCSLIHPPVLPPPQRRDNHTNPQFPPLPVPPPPLLPPFHSSLLLNLTQKLTDLEKKLITMEITPSKDHGEVGSNPGASQQDTELLAQETMRQQAARLKIAAEHEAQVERVHHAEMLEDQPWPLQNSVMLITAGHTLDTTALTKNVSPEENNLNITKTVPKKNKQAWAELGQAQIKLELGFTLIKI